MPWEDGLSREDLLAIRIQQLERRLEDIKISIKRLKEARKNKKGRFNHKHWLQPKAIQNGTRCWFMIVIWITNIAWLGNFPSDGLNPML